MTPDRPTPLGMHQYVDLVGGLRRAVWLVWSVTCTAMYQELEL
jgi:hypothetical protein